MDKQAEERYTGLMRRMNEQRKEDIRELVNLLSEPEIVLRIREIAREVAIPGPAGPMGPPAVPVDAVSRLTAP